MNALRQLEAEHREVGAQPYTKVEMFVSSEKHTRYPVKSNIYDLLWHPQSSQLCIDQLVSAIL